MAKKKQTIKVGSVGTLKIPLGQCLTGPTRRLYADLDQAQTWCDLARNAMFRHWQRYHEDHPDCDTVFPATPTDDQGEPLPGQSFSTLLYDVGREAAPQLISSVVALISNSEIKKNLTTDIRHRGLSERTVWRAIKYHLQARPTCREGTIPVPHNAAALGLAGAITVKGQKNPYLTALTGPETALAFPLFSREAGRQVTSPLVRLDLHKLAPGQRDLVRRIVTHSDGHQWLDSQLVKTDDRWSFHLSYQKPIDRLTGLDPDRIATLRPTRPGAPQPFLVTCPGTDAQDQPFTARWNLGHGVWLVAEQRRLNERRKNMRTRYQELGSAKKGHGRDRLEARFAFGRRQTEDHQAHFSWQLAGELLRFCERFACGAVHYLEPNLALRDHLWLAKQGVSLDWTSLCHKLRHKLESRGVLFDASDTTAADLDAA